MVENPVLEVKALRTTFITDDGTIPVVNDIDFQVQSQEILGIVGESGCGKSVTSLSIMGLIPTANGKVEGEILFNEENIAKATEKRMRSIRGNDIAMIFQEPMTSLNPVFTIGEQLIEAVQIHRKWPKKKAKEHAVQMLKKVGLPRAEQLINEYPHQLSGGMRQRVMIAMALACEPMLLIADEPTTALDVTIQAQILDLMKKLNKETNTAIIMITHDLGVVAEMCQRVIVMYSGKIVEEADVRTIFKEPKHPYTVGLIQSVPDMRVKKEQLYSIPGNVPKPGSIEVGCHFAPRCPHAHARCYDETPNLKVLDNGQKVRCWLYEEGKVGVVNE
ncbi:peptide ABC transporter ATP-binding protein [Heyndrickxia sporothermodurans]|uniref:ABC transporter ATP-binding protein n=1 Tax=Heyndrickxia sporothermodurans TaxID=46224 RepID=A0AB37HI94_9BACI|nr:ABC transporter ATP-binding protein [Heyndrickxia sporothermodurans]MBL5767314.1 ABC transporter ATP-binding protein [Heyndrickxia sporothermodurans]MBL5772529.1 ABC transporter ATP-binding protein [Heyndrickxia sporothermodurans]MBL5774384.1 ABC transporter ATP-binding protein [Heyndrickxia sporothermodurans]MBL5777945.1 ABC transporter ATP-binding protein [Heyndrickxia sporothermodurans]MBL5781327.1 ABC transporter ATP-binding protein [Heyndrickxia sporothermodurans]